MCVCVFVCVCVRVCLYLFVIVPALRGLKQGRLGMPELALGEHPILSVWFVRTT